MSPATDKLPALIDRMEQVPPILGFIVFFLALVVSIDPQPPLWAEGLLTFFYGMLVYAAFFSTDRRTNR